MTGPHTSLAVYVVTLEKIVRSGGTVAASSPEEAVDKIIMRSEGNPADWNVVSVAEVSRSSAGDLTLTVHADGPTEHVEPGAISFM